MFLYDMTLSSLTSIFFQVGEIRALAGVDFLTISPALLDELKKSTDPVPKRLDANFGKCLNVPHLPDH
jgi:transaldolase